MKFEIVYYTGTGGTALAAENLYRALCEAGASGGINRIAAKRGAAGAETDVFCPETLPPHDVLALLFPLHAFNAPGAVYKWIETLPDRNDEKGPLAVVIDVSGGGEVIPNMAGKVSTAGKLKKKGYDVFYEEMLVMPSNYLIPTDDILAAMLLEALPGKTNKIAADLLSGVRQRKAPSLIDRLFSKVFELEKPVTKFFGKRIQVTGDCDGCGLCAEGCPAANISLETGRPVFSKKCHLCLGCVYQCPKNALKPGRFRFIVLKEGFSLGRFKKMLPLKEQADIDGLAKGYLWSGVRKYLGGG